MRSPLEQFKIKELIKITIIDNNILLTDIVLYIIIGLIIIIISEKDWKKLKITKKIVIKEVKIEIIEKIIRMIVSGRERYIILLKTIFIFIITYNIIGMIPYNKTITSELILTISLSISILIGITIIGIKRNKIRLLNILIPENTPILLVPLLITIETISYIARGISLGLRLGANMIAGHTLLKIIILFIYSFINMDISKSLKINTFSNTKLLNNINLENEVIENIRNNNTIIDINILFILKWIIAIIPLIVLILIILLEIGVGIMQALVFVIITGIYINDVEIKQKGIENNINTNIKNSIKTKLNNILNIIIVNINKLIVIIKNKITIILPILIIMITRIKLIKCEGIDITINNINEIYYINYIIQGIILLAGIIFGYLTLDYILDGWLPNKEIKKNLYIISGIIIAISLILIYIGQNTIELMGDINNNNKGNEKGHTIVRNFTMKNNIENNVNMNPIARALEIGIGVGLGMRTVSTIIAKKPMPIASKIGITFLGGFLGGGINAFYGNIRDRGVKNEDIEIGIAILEYKMLGLYWMIYGIVGLVFLTMYILTIIYIANRNKDIELKWLDKITPKYSDKIRGYIIKAINNYKNYNKLWIIASIIMIIIGLIAMYIGIIELRTNLHEYILEYLEAKNIKIIGK